MTAETRYNQTYVKLLAVKPNFRGRQIGLTLLQAAEKFARVQGSEILTIATQDFQAREFYESFGFVVYGQLRDAPFKGTTKYLLEKRLG